MIRDTVVTRTHRDSFFSDRNIHCKLGKTKEHRNLAGLAAGIAGSRHSNDVVKNLLPIFSHLHFAILTKMVFSNPNIVPVEQGNRK